jgi:hypothetical protein
MRVLFAVVLVGCGFEQSNAIDLKPAPGMPVELKNVRMAEVLSAMLGAGPATFSSADGPNAISIAYDAHLVAEPAEHSGTTAQLACRVGEHTIVSALATDASFELAKAEVGTKLEQRETFFPTPFGVGIPTVCETTLYYSISPPLPVPPQPIDPDREKLHALGTVCFSDGKLVEGACSPDVLPRVPASAPLEVSRVVGRIGTVSGGGHGLEISVLVTAGETIPDDFMIAADASCLVGDAVRDVALPLLMFDRHLHPGESFWQAAGTPSGAAVESEPQWCTVDIRVAQDGVKQRLAQYCVRGDQATEGSCAED